MGKGKSPLFFGVIFLVVGLTLLFRNAGLLEVPLMRQLTAWWPVGLIFAGMAFLLGRDKLGSALIALTVVLAFAHAENRITLLQEEAIWPFPNIDIPGLNCILGSGNSSSEERKTGDFTGVAASSGVNVYLMQSPEQSLRVEADDNTLKYVATEVGDNVLKVSLKKCIQSQKPVKVYVSSKNISSISASSSARITGTSELKNNRIALDASSAGQIEVSVHAEQINAEASSAGIIRVSGSTDLLEVSASSGGMVDANTLSTWEATANANSAGIVQVSAVEKLSMNAESAGKIQYKGSPKYIEKTESSAGIVQKVD